MRKTLVRATVPASQPSRRTALLMAGVLLVLGFGVYGNAITNDFVIDDKIIIRADPRVTEGDVAALLTGEYWGDMGSNLLYRPLTKISFAANWAVSHEAWSFRVPNLLLHIGVAFVLFLLARDLTDGVWPAVVAAIVFIVHPIHSSSLNALVDRADLGAALFVLLAMWLYWRDGRALPVAARVDAGHRRNTTGGAASGGAVRPSRARPWLSALFFAAGLLCKENAVTLVGLVILLDMFCWETGGRLRPAGWLRRRIWRCYVPLVVILAAYLGVRVAVLGSLMRGANEISVVDNVIAHPEYGLQSGDSLWLARWGTPLAVSGQAFTLLLRPQPLCWDYSYAAIETVKRGSDPRLIVGASWLLLIAVTMVASYYRRRRALVALGIFLITFSIVSNTLVLAVDVFAERYVYLPSVGFCLLVGLVAGAAVDRLRTRAGVVLRALAASYLVVLAAGSAWYAWLTVERNRDWRCEATLNAVDLRTHPRSARLRSATATDALNARDFRTAVARAESAIEICTDFAPPWLTAGLAHWQLNEPNDALVALGHFFKLTPEGAARHEQANVAVAAILRARGEYGPAIEVLTTLVAVRPRAALARNNLAWYLLTAEPSELRNPPLALEHAEAAIALAPGQGDFVDTYISALLALGQRAEAAAEVRRLVPTLRPDDPYRAELAKKLVEP